MLTCLSAQQCLDYWDEIRDWLERVPNHHEWDEHYVKAQLKRCKAQCWVTLTPRGRWLGIFITQVKKRYGHQWLLYWILAGVEIDRWKDFIRVVDAWGKKEGCEFARTHGRRGWQKVLPDFKEVYTVFERAIN